jgi:hypothetical protein
MTDLIPGSLVQMRTLRRFSHYNAGEMIAVPMEAAQDLARKRLAQPIQILVPPQVAAAEPAAPTPRQPIGTVRK